LSLKDLVFDSYALLEWLLGQPKAAVVREYLEQAHEGRLTLWMSWINVGEALYMLARKRGAAAAEEFEQKLRMLPINMTLPTEENVLGAARIKAKARLAYADAFAVELALSKRCKIVTGDPEIMSLALGPIVWIGPD
jgi:predicted nucleic acid-binding protein